MRTFIIASVLLPLGMAAGLLQPLTAYAFDDPKLARSTPATRADEIYRQTRANYEAHPTNSAFAWKFASACFDQAEFTKTDDDRARIANEGIAACRSAISRDPNLAGIHYYLGMDLAQLARTELWGALSLLDEIEKEWLVTIRLDGKFDYGGAERSLGLLYRDAPGWPLSLGSRTKARQHLLRAVQVNPDYPENHLNLIETYIKWANYAEAHTAAAEYRKILEVAQKNFSGDAWESYWTDWNQRWAAIEAKLKESHSATLPHNKK